MILRIEQDVRMELNNLKNKIENSTIAVSTINNNKPHIIFILYPKIIDNKIVITDNYMKTTIKNLKKNNNICLAFFEGENGWRINGKAEYFNSGKWLEFAKSMKENEGLPSKGVIVIDVKEIKELG